MPGLEGGHFMTAYVLGLIFCLSQGPTEQVDLHKIPKDLKVPGMVLEGPGPGKRVKQKLPEYQGTEVYHALYLPTDWIPGKKYPVIFEYPGNGPFKNQLGDTNSGRVEDCNLGFGISAGKGFVWVCLPFVNKKEGKNQLSWWGEAEASADYCKKAVKLVCQENGGDRDRLVLAGFSRGAIACNYIGLRDEEIAGLWRGFIAHSHYDGVRPWPYGDSDRVSAQARLARLKGRPQFISHETSTAATKAFLQASGAQGAFTFVDLPFPNHTDTWVLRDLPARQHLREWVEKIIK
jgi:hypothetical protein